MRQFLILTLHSVVILWATFSVVFYKQVKPGWIATYVSLIGAPVQWNIFSKIRKEQSYSLSLMPHLGAEPQNILLFPGLLVDNDQISVESYLFRFLKGNPTFQRYISRWCLRNKIEKEKSVIGRIEQRRLHGGKVSEPEVEFRTISCGTGRTL